MPARYDRRQIFKSSLSFANVKVLYERITLNHLTVCYTIAAVIACIVLVSLQAVIFVDNSQAIARLTPIVQGPNVPSGIPIELDGHNLFICSSLNDETAETCRLIVDFTASVQTPTPPSDALSESCVVSLMYLDDMVHNARREDVVTFVFQVWMLGVSLFAIIAQSIPHISAAFFGHVLGTIWSVYRLASTSGLRAFYQTNVVPKACGGVDVVGNWCNRRIGHDTATTVLNILVLLVISFLSLKLYDVYTSQTRARVAASPQVYSAFKLFLLFSAALQLSMFYALASTGMWIDKVSHAPLKQLATDSTMCLAGFIVALIFQVPWLLLGWTAIRYEGRKIFLGFLGISGGLLILFTVMFFSQIYLYTFVSWPFFAAMTTTSYVLLVLTTVLAVICRLRFGQGLAEFLNMKDELEAADFTATDFHASLSRPVVINVDTFSISDVEKNPATLSPEISEWNAYNPPKSPEQFPETVQFASQVDTGADLPPSWLQVPPHKALKVPRLPPPNFGGYAIKPAPLSPAPSTVASKKLKSKWSISTVDDLTRRSTATSSRISVKTTTTTTTHSTLTGKVPQLPKLDIPGLMAFKEGRDFFGARYRDIEMEMEVDAASAAGGENVDLAHGWLKMQEWLETPSKH